MKSTDTTGADMHAYRVTIKTHDGEIAEQFVQHAAHLRLALEVSTHRLAGLAAGHDSGIAEANVEILGGYIGDPDTGAPVFSTDVELLRQFGRTPITRDEADALRSAVN